MTKVTVKTLAAVGIATLAISVASLVLSLTTLTVVTAKAAAPAERPAEAVTAAEPAAPAEEEPDLYREDIPLGRELQQVLRESCAQSGIPFEVGVGLIEVESSFHPEAVSPSGCYGLCQLNPKYFPSGLSDEENIQTGMEYLAEQLERYEGDLDAALTAYNAGHDTGKRLYASKVMAAAEYWRD